MLVQNLLSICVKITERKALSQQEYFLPLSTDNCTLTNSTNIGGNKYEITTDTPSPPRGNSEIIRKNKMRNFIITMSAIFPSYQHKKHNETWIMKHASFAPEHIQWGVLWMFKDVPKNFSFRHKLYLDSILYVHLSKRLEKFSMHLRKHPKKTQTITFTHFWMINIT